jgi:putative transcriptional regulator
MGKRRSPLANGILTGLADAVDCTKDNKNKAKKNILYTTNAKAIRKSLALSQTEFSQAYKIPLSTLKNWEQGRRSPDATASAYLWTIEQMPKEVQTALIDSSHD